MKDARKKCLIALMIAMVALAFASEAAKVPDTVSDIFTGSQEPTSE